MRRWLNKIGYSIAKLVLWVQYQIKHHKFKFIFSSFLAFIGFILSPLSWWNDLFVNVPLAFGFAWLIAKLLSYTVVVNKALFTTLFAIGYLITNILGFLMIHYSVVNLSDKNKISIKEQIWVSLVYTALILLLGYLDIFSVFGAEYSIFPNFVK